MRDQEIVGLWEAYLQVHQPQEEVEQLDELAPATPRNRQRAVNRRQRQFDRTPMSNSTGGSGEERKALSRLLDTERLSAAASKRRNVDENYDTFDTILEYLVSEGYADTNESALVIMANMSEEWRQSIVEMAYTVNVADVKGGTKAAKNAQAGMKDKSGNPMYNPGVGVGPDFKLKGV